MLFSFCKKSVFSILFLLLFFLGTICGILLFRFIFIVCPEWIRAYGSVIEMSADPFSFQSILIAAVPFLLIFFSGFCTWGQKLIYAVIFLRACFLSYYSSVIFCAAVSQRQFLIYRFLLLLAFYFFCQHFWVSSSRVNGNSCCED